MIYYNDNDPQSAAWLRELITQGHLPAGDVDDRSILDVEPADLVGYTQCHFFAGIGGWSYALRLAGWPDDRPVWTGSPPCQPFSVAGRNLGRDDERHLAPHFLGLVTACRPPALFGEQVASAAVFGKVAKKAGGETGCAPEWAWIDDVSAHLEDAHYAVGALDLPAAGIGAPHLRQRCFFGAYDLRSAAGGVEHGAGDGWEQRRTEPEGRGAAGGCGTDRLADADGGEPGQAGAIQPSGEYGLQPEGCGSLGLVDSIEPRLERQSGDGDDRSEPRRHDKEQDRPATEAGAACEFCGYVFDQDALGRYGCPNCYGEGLDTRSSPTNGVWRDADWLADAERIERERGRAGEAVHEPGTVERVERLRDALGLAYPSSERRGQVGCDTGSNREEDEGWSRDRHGDGGADVLAGGVVGTPRPGPTNGVWRDADWLFCTDGKWRAVEPGTFPLAHGVPSRVGLLRGYGNAIVPQLAAAFILAFEEARDV